jgi:death-on-curing protein
VTRHLSLADVVALHATMMRAMGWPPAPLRGGGEALLESAVMRPQMAEHYASADLIRQAAVLGVGISQAQAFVDGNKRTALFALVTFLEANGCSLDFDDLELARELEKVAERTDSLEAATERFETWLRALAERQRQPPGG